MKIYYAHSLHIYDTNQENRDIARLEQLGFEVINPNSSIAKEKVAEIKANHNGSDPGAAIMEYFSLVVSYCDALAFRSLADGSIPAGVWKEVTIAREVGLPIIELPHILDKRALSVADTRAILGYNGHR